MFYIQRNMKNQIKIPWENFVKTALAAYKGLYPNIDTDTHPTADYPMFVKDRHGEGEGSLAELPDYVYLDIEPT